MLETGLCEPLDILLTGMIGDDRSTDVSEGNPATVVRRDHCGYQLLHPHTVCGYTGTTRTMAASTWQRCRHGPLALTLSGQWAASLHKELSPWICPRKLLTDVLPWL